MSKVLLINPDARHILENAGDRPPLGLLYIASYLRKNGHDVHVWDGNNNEFAILFAICNGFKPDYIGISAYTSPIINNTIEIATILKGKYPKIKFVVGGHHASALPKTLENIFDYIVIGEGEKFLEEIEKNPNKKIIIPEKIKNIDEIPMPARDLVYMSYYNMKQNGERTATLITSRGCPGNCVFCSNTPSKVRFHSPKRVEKEVKELISLYKYKSFYFVDDCFTFNKERVEEICKRLKPLNISYRITTRADKLSDGLISKLADSGCKIISIGIESGNDKILKNVRKRMDTTQNEYVVKLCHKYNIDVKGFFIIGLPFETEKTARDTIEFAKKLKRVGLTSADFYLLTPFPGTDIYNNPKKYGLKIIDKNFSQYLQIGKIARAKIRTKELSGRRLEELIKIAKEEFENV